MNDLELLRNFFRHVVDSDPQVRSKLDRLRSLQKDPGVQEAVTSLSELAGGLERADDLAIETIVSRVGRPVLAVVGTEYRLEGPETEVWRDRLGTDTARNTFRKVIPAVGRIEVDRHQTHQWLGTGWLVREDIITTNRHVAEEFGRRNGDRFVFRRGADSSGQLMAARVDFREEIERGDPREFQVLDILHIEPDDGPDLAFLRISKQGSTGSLAMPLQLARNGASPRDYVATIGYPAADSRVPDQDLVLRIFGDVYDVKRMAPGQVQRSDGELVTHDCSTLGGNSGSPVVRLDNGEVIALHFSGLFLRENRSVPAALISERLDRLDRRPRPPAPEPKGEKNGDTGQRGAMQSAAGTPGLTFAASQQEAVWTIPLEVTVRLGQPKLAVGSADRGTISKEPTTVKEAVNHVRDSFGSSKNVLAVREGYVFRDGWITDERAVTIIVKDRNSAESPGQFPDKIGNIPVQVRLAGPWDYLEAQEALEQLEGVPPTSYKKPEGFALEETNEEVKVTCHISPDAGWPTLKSFLSKTSKRLTLGMYDFTAPHIVTAVEQAVEDAPNKFTMVLQKKASLGTGTKKDDIPEEEVVERYTELLGDDRFRFAWASVGKNRQFASAYHIKVAVQDNKSFWLSSGNWQSSNQPDIEIDEESWHALMTYNREWHVVVQCPALAKQFEQFLQFDLKNAQRDAETEAPPLLELEFFVDAEVAIEARRPSGTPRYFSPKTFQKTMRVQPLLTPDNYQEEVLKLIRAAKKQILFQNQSFSLLDDDKNEERFTALAKALQKKQKDGIDVRIIMRGEFDVSRPLEKLKDNGFDMDRVRLQDRCHTKGIVVDGKSVLIGSHNWTNQGTLVNRDASLIFHDEEVAAYFADAFWFDWKNLTRQSVAGSRRVRIADDEAREAPTGMVRMSWQEIVLD